jgi:hypothetical protein
MHTPAMKSFLLIVVHVACAFILFSGACSNNHPANLKLLGKWRPKTKGNVLTITDKQFAMDSPEPEDYFVKGDTIYTSFEGNLPYSKYAIKKLDDKYLTIFTPDSTTIEYERR